MIRKTLELEWLYANRQPVSAQRLYSYYQHKDKELTAMRIFRRRVARLEKRKQKRSEKDG